MYNAGDLLDPDISSRLRHFNLKSKRTVCGTRVGDHKSSEKGASPDFNEFRKYTPGDEINKIDWRLYGRSDRYYVKEYDADTNLRCYMMIDCSASMGFKSNSLSKYQFAGKLSAHLAQNLLQKGEAVGLQLFNEKRVARVPLKTGKNHLQHCLKNLQEVKPKGRTDIGKNLSEAACELPRRSMVLIFSDFFTDIKKLFRDIGQLNSHQHDIVIFHMLDRQELEFNFNRLVRFVCMEDSDSLQTDPESIRNEYFKRFNSYLASVRQHCLSSRVEYRQAITQDGVEKVLKTFFLERKGKVR